MAEMFFTAEVRSWVVSGRKNNLDIFIVKKIFVLDKKLSQYVALFSLKVM
jgi:hypothetical protein